MRSAEPALAAPGFPFTVLIVCSTMAVLA